MSGWSYVLPVGRVMFGGGGSFQRGVLSGVVKSWGSFVRTQTIAEMVLVGSAVLEELQKNTISKIDLDLAEFRWPNVRSLRTKTTKTYNI